MTRPRARAGAGGGQYSLPRALFCSIVMLVLLTASRHVRGESAAQRLRVTRGEVESAYLYNFGRFLRWPDEAAQGPMNLCILGQDPFDGALDHIVAHETIEGRVLAVRRLGSASEAGACSILFLSRSEQPRMEEDLARVRTLPVATVSELPGFLDRGGIIQFLLEDDRVRFQVNVAAARKAGIVISSQLLKVAAGVVGNADGGEAR